MGGPLWTESLFSAGVAESTRRHIAWLEAEIAQLEKESFLSKVPGASVAVAAAPGQPTPRSGN